MPENKTLQEKSLKDLLKELQELRNETIYIFDYKYYNLKISPHGDILVPDEESNEKFGNSRKGYELFKREHQEELSIGYSGEISLREVYIRATNEVIGYVQEKKKSTRPYVEKAQEVYEEIYNNVIKELGVKDVETFNYFIERDGPGYDLFEKDPIMRKKSEASYIIELVQNYNECDEFRKYLDKIIK